MKCREAIAAAVLLLASLGAATAAAQSISFDASVSSTAFPLVHQGAAAPIYVASSSAECVKLSAQAFAQDVHAVSGATPKLLTTLKGARVNDLVLVGVLGQAPEIDRLVAGGQLSVGKLRGEWESAVTAVVLHPMPGVERAFVVVGSDRRGAAFALFRLSREMGVSPWHWWADVPAPSHRELFVQGSTSFQQEPSIPYRGIFLNDEDWGLRPWAAKKMDPSLGNIGPHTYERIFELLLRLHANTLWPAMHPGTRVFNATAENSALADRWGIVMGSSHSEALLRNNVGEWDEKRDGPWNYQINKPGIDAYWDKRLRENGRYENFYTVGMRGVHDTGLEATGSTTVKARLVEDVMRSQQAILKRYTDPAKYPAPEVIWLYKESLELYRAGMQVPENITLGWTDDNYGYIRQLPTSQEQKRLGGSGVYYHVSYWGFPHDYLWLCTTPPALIREEMTKAYDHGARRYWVLNVGDIKPAEVDIDYFFQLAEDEPRMAKESQREYLDRWSAEQFSGAPARAIASLLNRYYALNFVRKPEFMGFNGYNDGINRTSFNPSAWGDQNRERENAWEGLQREERAVAAKIPSQLQDAFFELVGYPVEAAAAQNKKFLRIDRSYLDAAQGNASAMSADGAAAQTAYDAIQTLTARYNDLEGGKWSGIMSDAPREREVFKMPTVATSVSSSTSLPTSWSAGKRTERAKGSRPDEFLESDGVVSMRASHTVLRTGDLGWHTLQDLGITGDSIVYGAPGKIETAEPGSTQAALEYRFATVSNGPAKLEILTLPTFPLDSAHRQRFAVVIDGSAAIEEDLSGSGEWHENSAPTWAANVLRNTSITTVELQKLAPGPHTVRLLYRDPGVVFEHLVLAFPGSAPAYPVPPESLIAKHLPTELP